MKQVHIISITTGDNHDVQLIMKRDILKIDELSGKIDDFINLIQ